ncbi:MAG: UDP-glucose/GDP-mannose dehydrogenase family protein [Synergistaceae bacterium]|nr:UDP-glucose/GDP-mannose dehydrogenase family protein [Synergistaceae bacterium]
MRLTVVGTGYVGLVTGVCLAKFGNNVRCVDKETQKIDKLKKGEVPFYEPGLSEIICNNTEAGRLEFTTSIPEALKGSQICFITVGTPSNSDGSANLSYVQEVARTIGRSVEEALIVVVKSTVPVNTCEMVRNLISEELNARKLNEEIYFDVVSNPEFLREGSAVRDFLEPDRVIVGTDSERAAELMKELYNFLPPEKLLFMDIRSSEMSKYAANAMLATRISFMNEIANICDYVGADIEKVRVGIGSDNRIGYPFLRAGCGYGGSCFPKDVRALKDFASKEGYFPRILQAVEDVNESQKTVLFSMISKYYGRDGLRGKTIGLWGLAFKPKTSDVRDAPAQALIRSLAESGAAVRAHDPKAIEETHEALGDLPNVIYVHDQYDAVNGSDALVLLTEWDIYKQPDFERLKALLNGAVIFDGRNQYSPSEMKRNGFKYFSIGRPSIL